MMRIASDKNGNLALNRLSQSEDFKWFLARLAQIAAEKVVLGHKTDGSERFRLDGDVRTLLALHEEVTGSKDALAAATTPGVNRIRTARILGKARA